MRQEIIIDQRLVVVVLLVVVVFVCAFVLLCRVGTYTHCTCCVIGLGNDVEADAYVKLSVKCSEHRRIITLVLVKAYSHVFNTFSI